MTREPVWQRAAAWAVALVCCGLAWAWARPAGDTFLALAGGRDVLAGRLGGPDDWSAVTAGRVWVHSNWGADALLYLAHRAGGAGGLLAAKALLLALVVLACAWAARTRGASWSLGAACGGLALAAWPEGAILRGNLFTLLLLPVLLGVLARARENPGWLLLAPLLFAAWCNLHGGHLLGLGLLAGWALLEAAAGPGSPRRRLAGLATLAVSAAVCAFANPFGPRNLSLGGLRSGSGWEVVTEWLPFWAPPIRAATPWLFFALVAAAGAGLIAAHGRRDAASRRALRFDAAVVVVAAALGLRARRFLLVGAVLAAPVLAAAATPAWRRRPAAGAAALVAAAAAAVVLHGWVFTHYRPLGNPLHPAEGVLARMTGENTHFPAGAAAFLADNGIAGAAFHEYRWESYLRWRCPRVKVYVGGRAHQVYRGEDEALRRALVAGQAPVGRLREQGVFLAVLPLDDDYAAFLDRLLVDGWAYVYADRRAAVLADTRAPGGRAVVTGVVEGRWRYPDAAAADLSRGMCLGSPEVPGTDAAVAASLQDALKARPVAYAYALFADRAAAAGTPGASLVRWFEAETQRLAAEPAEGADGLEIWKSRRMVWRVLESLHRRAGRADAASAARAEAARCDDAMLRQVRRWR